MFLEHRDQEVPTQVYKSFMYGEWKVQNTEYRIQNYVQYQSSNISH